MAQIVGVFRIGRDAELRYTQSNDPVVSLSLAFNYGQKDQDGNKPTQWIDAALWGKRAEAMAQYLTKGIMIYAVISDPHIEQFQKRDGGEGFKLAGRIAEIEFAGNSQQQNNQQQNNQQQNNQQRQDGQQRQNQGTSNRQQQNRQKPSFDDLGDDIPF